MPRTNARDRITLEIVIPASRAERTNAVAMLALVCRSDIHGNADKQILNMRTPSTFVKHMSIYNATYLVVLYSLVEIPT